MIKNWRLSAACRNCPVEWFYPVERDNTAYNMARSVCETCAVQEECLNDALATEFGHRDGMRAGKTPAQRVRLQRLNRKKENQQSA